MKSESQFLIVRNLKKTDLRPSVNRFLTQPGGAVVVVVVVEIVVVVVVVIVIVVVVVVVVARNY